ncbi:MAG: hypothetical protein QF785_04580 [Phycisphaeraceae bacterium]|jgi:hypothetical protein|nr:hypothetical protein [Phycisphaeraceae bacterium]
MNTGEDPQANNPSLDDAATGSLRAGVARIDITTNEEAVRVKDPLFAKSLVLDDGATQVVIIAMDAAAIGGICDIKDDFLPKLRGRIEAELNIPGQHVLVNASHTHPPSPLLCEDDEILNRTFDAVSCAAADLTPVKVGVGAGHEDRITINRTLRMKNGLHWTVRHANPCPPDDEVEGIAPIDPQIGVIRIDRLDGRPLAVIYNFACHLLFGDPQGSVTANFVGVASKVIEDALGHGATALFLQGAAGDVIDVLFKDFHRPRDVEPLGNMLALSTLEAVRGIDTGNAELKVITETVVFPRRTDIPRRIEALEHEQTELLASLRFTTLDFKTFMPMYIRYALDPDHPADFSFRYLQAKETGSDAFTAMDTLNRENMDKYVANIRAMEKLARIQDRIATLQRHQAINDEAGEPTITAEMQGIRIGDCVLITSTTEVLTEVALNIKRSSPYKHTLVAAFSNGYIHYGPPADDYDKGGYEVTECFIAPQWQKIFEDKAGDIISRL